MSVKAHKPRKREITLPQGLAAASKNEIDCPASVAAWPEDPKALSAEMAGMGTCSWPKRASAMAAKAARRSVWGYILRVDGIAQRCILVFDDQGLEI